MPRTIKDIQRERQHKIDERDREIGWYTPTKRENLVSLREKVAKKRAELKELEGQLKLMEDEAKLEAIVMVRNLMRAYDISFDELKKPRRRRPKTDTENLH
jgi:hypothetical protein